ASSHNSMLIVTWDEGRGDNHIATILFGAGVKHGKFGQRLTHYRLLRTIEKMYGLTPLANATDAAPLRRPFVTPIATASLAPASFSQQPIAGSSIAVPDKLDELLDHT